MKKIIIKIFLIIVSGIFLILAFPPFNKGIFAWIALVPFFFAIKNVSGRIAFYLGFLVGMVWFGGTLHWLYGVFGVASISLIAILSFFIGLFGAGHSFFIRRYNPILTIGITSILWIAIEFFRSECWTLKFSWMTLGYSQTQHLLLLQLVSILGVYGISFLIVIVNVVIYFTIENWRLKGKIITLWGIMGIGIFLILLYGKAVIPENIEGEYTVVGIQDESSCLDKYLKKTKTISNEKPNLVVWPEYALLENVLSEPEILDILLSLASEVNSYLILGCTDTARNPSEFYNTAIIISPKHKVVGKYYKMNPIQLFSDGLHGKTYSVFPTPLGKIGIEICYDMDYTYVSRNLVKHDAEILVIPTYDAKRWGRIQHLQHSAMTVFRAIENRRFVVRVASSGISQIIDPYGNVLNSLGVMEEGVVIGKVSPQRYLSFYTKFGWLFPFLCQIIISWLIITNIIAYLKTRNWLLHFPYKEER
ncbi:MAG: nitrilase-related carbon-nitrogen hydrolase [bacterium]